MCYNVFHWPSGDDRDIHSVCVKGSWNIPRVCCGGLKIPQINETFVYTTIGFEIACCKETSPSQQQMIKIGFVS